MTTTITAPSVTELAAALAAMQSQMNTIAAGLAAALEGQQVTAPSQPVSQAVVTAQAGITLTNGLTLDTVKAYAKSKGMNITGRVTQERYDQWAALYQSDHTPSVAVQAAQAMQAAVTNGSPWGEFAQREQSAERQFGQPKRAEAAEMFRVHPERDFVNSMPVPALYLFSQAGKPTAKVSEFRLIPLNGNHRKCIGLLARGTSTDSIKLVVADALLIAKSAGVDIVAAIRRFNSAK